MYGGNGGVDRTQQLIEAMKRGKPGGPLMGGIGGPNLGRISGRPSMGGNSVRGGFMNRRPGLAPLGFSPYAAQMAQGHQNLQAPSNLGLEAGVGDGPSRGYAGQGQEGNAQMSPQALPQAPTTQPRFDVGAQFDPIGNPVLDQSGLNDPFAALAALSPAEMLQRLQPQRNPWGAYSRNQGMF